MTPGPECYNQGVMNSGDGEVPEETAAAALNAARRVLFEEAEALRAMAERLNERFARAVALLRDCAGRVVVTGMGKSGIVGRKIAATLASTGTPAFFLHPAEALHGDLGMVVENDIVIGLSYSGESDEVRAILPALRRRAAAIVALTGNARSTLAEASDLVLDVCVTREACPHNLAPTTSTTAMMALGDALAIAVMEARGFGAEDYALLHPAGSLGRRLLLRVSDVMRAGDRFAIVPEDATLHDALFAITRANVGAACVVGGEGRLSGFLTDGDVRRFLLQSGAADALARPVSEAMTKNPHFVRGDALAIEAYDRLEHDRERIRIADLPVVDEQGKPVGLLMLKDMVRAGIVLPTEDTGPDAASAA